MTPKWWLLCYEMKLRIYFVPGAVVALLGLVALAFALGAAATAGGLRLLAIAAAGFYACLCGVAFRAWLALRRREIDWQWPGAERLLILAPHQDDCVIMAAGMAIQNKDRGGCTRIAYVAQEADESIASTRRDEAEAAWLLAGVPATQLQHLDLLPPLRVRDAARLGDAAHRLAALVREFAPTVIVVPAFEGGHIHHDVLNHIVTRVVQLPADCRVLECPEYSPYFSMRRTPHRVIAMCGRCIAGMVAYYGPPEGVDDRTVSRLSMTQEELAMKRKMLSAFRSQNSDSLAETRGYRDRFLFWSPRPYRAQPFEVNGSYVALSRALESCLPPRFVRLLLPGMFETHGREPGITNLDDEYSPATDS